MSTYRLEVRGAIPRGYTADDLAAAVIYAVEDSPVEVETVSASTVFGPDLARVTVAFKAADDQAAQDFQAALPSRIRSGWSVEASGLRTGRGRSFREVR